MMLTDLAQVLRNAGLPVEEYPGWKTRGHGEMRGVRGIAAHHTATSSAAKGNMPTLRILAQGHGSLKGPLSQLGLGRDGTWYVVAAGRCYHAGPADDVSMTNSWSIGVEAEHSGSGPWPQVQYDSYVAGVAALRKHYGVELKNVRGHKEFATPYGRKNDPNFDMSEFRRKVAAHSGRATASGPVETYEPQIRRLAGYLGVPEPKDVARWTADEAFVKAVQAWLGEPETGAWGRQSNRRLQTHVGATRDGIWGPNTTAGLKSFLDNQPPPRSAFKPNSLSAVKNAQTVPAEIDVPINNARTRGPFPLPVGHWYGPESNNPKNHSGYYKKDRAGIRQIQSVVGERADGSYGSKTASAVKYWQKTAGLAADGLVGQLTWSKMGAGS